MPTIDHKYKTSYAFAQDLVQLYAPLTQRCLLPSYRKPDITVKISSTCDPDFAALMKSVCAKLDLTDQAQFSDEECRLFRYHRMHGPHKLYRTGLSGQHLFASQRYHQERLFMLMYSLANLLGEKILSRLGREQFARWFPWNAFRCGFDKSGRGFTLHCASLARRVTKDG